jgi:indolepyruvate ferredoxin oxidoreductase
MMANLFLTGLAYQGGLIPVSLKAIDQAIEWNGVEIEKNRLAFLWGRKYYEDAAWVEAQLQPATGTTAPAFDRVAELRAYQDEGYARSYSDFLARIENPELRDVVGKYLYKLMAYKDEYEVARLLTKPAFEAQLREMWAALESISYHLHPPLLRRFGMKNKLKLGPAFRPMLVLLSRLRVLRGTVFDVFGRMPHRKKERALIGWYRELIEQVMRNLTPENLTQALGIAALPDQIRGYEDIKEQSIERVQQEAAEKLAQMTLPILSQSTAR